MILTLRHFFSKPVTVQYPYEKLKHKDRFRGQLKMVIDPETKEPHCTACGLCAKNCPDRLIVVEVEKVDGKRVLKNWQFNLGACMFCGLCVEACPFDAITMSKEYELAVYNPRRLLYNKERLLEDPVLKPKEKKAAKKEGQTTSKPSEATKKTESKDKVGSDTSPDSCEPSKSDAPKAAAADNPADKRRESAGTEPDMAKGSAKKTGVKKQNPGQLELGVEVTDTSPEEKPESRDD